MRSAVFAFLGLVAGALAVQAQGPGVISGRVTNALTGLPLAGATVDVAVLARRTESDATGAFTLTGLAPGIYQLRVRAIGFTPATAASVVVGSAKPAVVGVMLTPAPVILSGIEVTPGYFPRVTEPAADRRLLDGEEVRRAPGVQEDVIRAVALLPGVGVTVPGRNDLVVRGGAPYENLFVVDGVEIPNLNHFGSQGSGGGPLALVNVDFVEETAFSAGLFASRFGDRTAGLTEVRLRDGNPLALGGELNLSATGAGAMLEGPLGARTSFWAGIRRSYLDLLFRAAGFSFVPTYWDGQLRVASRPTEQDQLSAFWIGALDGVTLYSDDADARYDNSRLVVPEQRQYAGGLTWRHATATGALAATLGRSFVRFATVQRDSLDPPRETFANRSREGETSLRVDWQEQAARRLELNTGVVTRYAGALRYTMSLDGAHRRDAAGIPRPLAVDTSFSAWRLAGYLDATVLMSAAISVTVGARMDHYAIGRRSTLVSPRARLRFALTPGTGLTLGGGRLVQPPQYIWLVGDPGNGALLPAVADQVGLALETRPRDDWRVRVEAYIKSYRRYAARAFRPQAVLSPTGFEDVTTDIPFGLEPLVSSGRGRAQGIELLVQKKPGRGPFYGLATATLASSRFAGVDGVWRPGAFDTRLTTSVLTAARAGAWELSAKFRAATGAPTTPFVSTGPDAGSLDFTRYHAGPRLPLFHALDVRVDRRWSLGRIQLETYLDVQNVYGRPSVTGYRWDQRAGRAVADESLGVLPSVGLNLEF